MAFPKPTGKYADRMLEPGGWPGIDEMVLHDRSAELTAKLQALTHVLEDWLHEQTEISSGTIWSGSGANAGLSAVAHSIDAMANQQSTFVSTISWLSSVFATVLNAKISILNRVVATEAEIAALESTSLNPEARSNQIESLVKD